MRTLVVLVLSLAALTARAAGEAADSVQALRAELERLKAAQAEGAAQIQSLEARIVALEAPAAQDGAVANASVRSAVPAEAPLRTFAETRYDDAAKPRLTVTGDFRLRYEGNYGDDDARDWERGVLRARLGATYLVNDWLTVGGRLATGDPDDPNSTDVTLSNFADDFDVSLDQAYAELRLGEGKIWGGKFALPFARTDLVWDGDVNPQGISATYAIPVGGGALRMSGLYFLVDQSVAGADSSMLGGQLGIDLPFGSNFRFELSGALYDYTLPGVVGADVGDFRSNLIGPDGRYVSDFDLADAIAAVSYGGWEGWPVRLTGEYVTNRGARTTGDTGYSIELSAGQVHARGDWRFGYGYSVAEVDAVLAAFSQDNTTIATNYRQHTLYLDYALSDKIVLDTTLYHYRPYDAEFSGINDPADWLDRLRVNFQVAF